MSSSNNSKTIQYIQEQQNVTLSSSYRDTCKYPDSNSFKIDLPSTIRNVVQISLIGLEMNMSEQTINQGQNDLLQFGEGLRCGSGWNSTSFQVEDEAVSGSCIAGPAYMPSYLNPVVEVDENKVYTALPVGIPSSALACLASAVLIGVRKKVPVGPYTNSTILMASDIDSIVDGPVSGKPDANGVITFKDTVEICDVHAFLHVPALSPAQICTVINSQLAAFVKMSINTHTGLYIARWLRGTRRCSRPVFRWKTVKSFVCKGGGGDNCQIHAMEALGFRNGQPFVPCSTMGGLVAKAGKVLHSFDARVLSFNAAPSEVMTLVPQVLRALQPGSVHPHHMLSSLPYVGTYVDAGQTGNVACFGISVYGCVRFLPVPVHFWFRDPWRVAEYLQEIITQHISPGNIQLEWRDCERRFVLSADVPISITLDISDIRANITGTPLSTRLIRNLALMLGFKNRAYTYTRRCSDRFELCSETEVLWPRYRRTHSVCAYETAAEEGDCPWVCCDNSVAEFEHTYPGSSYGIDKAYTSPNRLKVTTKSVYRNNQQPEGDVNPYFFMDVDDPCVLIDTNKFLTPYLTCGDVVYLSYVIQTVAGVLLVEHEDGEKADEVGSEQVKCALLVVRSTSNNGRVEFFNSCCFENETTISVSCVGVYEKPGPLELYHPVCNSINHVLGVDMCYFNDVGYVLGKQYDVMQNHAFAVTLRDLPNIKKNNTFIVQDPQTGQLGTRQILTRVAAYPTPVTFDRGQTFSVSLVGPYDISSLHIELLDEKMQRLLQTNKQDISLIFMFKSIVNAM